MTRLRSDCLTPKGFALQGCNELDPSHFTEEETEAPSSSKLQSGSSKRLYYYRLNARRQIQIKAFIESVAIRGEQVLGNYVVQTLYKSKKDGHPAGSHRWSMTITKVHQRTLSRNGQHGLHTSSNRALTTAQSKFSHLYKEELLKSGSRWSLLTVSLHGVMNHRNLAVTRRPPSSLQPHNDHCVVTVPGGPH